MHTDLAGEAAFASAQSRLLKSEPGLKQSIAMSICVHPCPSVVSMNRSG
jgi:hypothetical protein